MNLNRFLLPLGIASAVLTSCTYPPPPGPSSPLTAESPDPAPPTVTSPEQENIRKSRDEARRDSERRSASNPPETNEDEDPSPPPKKDYRSGVPIPGREGFVFNPFTNNPVDVRGIPPGTLVVDPQDPNPDHKFRVP